MSRIGEPTANHTQPDVFSGQVDAAARAHHDILRGLDGKQVCPFCGSVSEKASTPCARCGMDNTPDARKATKARIGPWYVLQARNPAAPGMRFETLLSFVRKGRVRARSVVRGPTTHQLWRFAAHVKGLSREFGLCFSCGSVLDSTANICPQCNRLQEPPLNPDTLLEDGEEGSGRPPIYRELPAPPAEPEAKAKEEDADFVIPAFGAAAAAVEPTPAPAPKPAPKPAAPAPAPSPFRTSSVESSPDLAIPSPRRPSGPSPAPRKENGQGGGFLTAKELAAAFRLSFDPSATMEAIDIPDDRIPAGVLPPDDFRPRNNGGGGGGGGGGSPKRLPVVPDPSALRKPRGRRRGAFAKFVLFVLILAGTGFGVLMWVDPGFRQKTVDWSKGAVAKLQNLGNKSENPTNVAPTTSTTSDSSDPMDIPNPPDATSAKAGASNATNEIPRPKNPDVASELASPPTPRDATPAPIEKPAPAPAPIAKQETPAEPKPTHSLSDAQLEAKMKELRTAALAARRKGDLKAELGLWNEMSQLPPGYHDGNMKVRIKYLTDELKKSE